MDGALDIARGVLELRAHLAQFFQLHLAADFRLDVVDVALRTAYQRAYRARDLGQPFGTDHDQCHGADQRQLGNAEINHADTSCGQHAE